MDTCGMLGWPDAVALTALCAMFAVMVWAMCKYTGGNL